MPTFALVLFVLIVLAGVAQAVFLVALAREGLRAGRRIDTLAEEVGRELQPALANFSKAARQFAEVSDVAALQARRVDFVVNEAVAQIERTQTALRELVLPRVGRLAAASTIVRIARAGYQLYRRYRG